MRSTYKLLQRENLSFHLVLANNHRCSIDRQHVPVGLSYTVERCPAAVHQNPSADRGQG